MSVTIKWSHDCFADYKNLAYQFYKCGYATFDEVFNDTENNVKSDMWFLTGIYLIRHSLELGLKALLCRVLGRKREIENTFEECRHDVYALLRKYIKTGKENFLTADEGKWILRYLYSLEEVDQKSDMFRFPFEDEFLSKYRNKILDNIAVANNLLQGWAMVKKCIERGNILEEEKFDDTLKPDFFIFTTNGFGNCCLWQKISDKGFQAKITGYSEVIDYIYQNQNIAREDKIYPLMFMSRNTIELCLKRLFFSRVDSGVTLLEFKNKRKSHLIKKDLWKSVKPVIIKYAKDTDADVHIIDIADGIIDEIDALDKNGDIFRYPTSYSLEYRFDNKVLDIENVYVFLKSIINFLDGCGSMLSMVEDYQKESCEEIEFEIRGNLWDF